MRKPVSATTWRSRGLAAVAVAALAATSGCGMFGGGATPSPNAASASPDSASPSTDDTVSPSGSPSPGDTTPGSTPTPSDSGTPLAGTTTPSASASTSTSGSAAPVSCTSVTPIRIQKVSVDPRRTIEIVTLVSDGRNLTPGTREQGVFGAPTLTAPDGSEITDEATTSKIADLIKGSSRNRVLLTRPDPPDTGSDASRRPYNSPGTYVAYNASSPLTADVIVQCSGQEQRWQYTAEADLTTGQVNCAVEPPKSNAVARLVYTNNC